MITIPLRILLVEDNEADVILTKRTIKKIVEKPEIAVVEDLTACRERMVNFAPDVVISDYNLPSCTGLDVLQLVQEIDGSVPFIFLTGTINDEELAANTILAGAWGYILKKDMNDLEERLKPLLKKVVFNLSSKDELRERLRENRIAVNQIYDYLESLNSDNKEQKENIIRIKENLSKFDLGDEDGKA
ncbi:Response regulator receiver domain-containing protein [Salinimicrobium catena]|uniref:Response regulator receiver domain-containing protein n=2 Tax=Salinimicrobium catena TaxID=390640 RepID=A0A1H5N137_9FLAO|nr:Response regulator receiver domain-containing protein [Salinimicrobium catena]SEE95295.1 Response regulator receiver domain-containing protein [Salinimicrobium catena]